MRNTLPLFNTLSCQTSVQESGSRALMHEEVQMWAILWLARHGSVIWRASASIASSVMVAIRTVVIACHHHTPPFIRC